jgi:tryptophanyl-tRNA synthetase
LRAAHATPLLAQLREAVGLRDLSKRADAVTSTVEKRVAPTFKQYREADGKFYFKLVDGDRVLLQSGGFDSARDAGQLVARAKQDAARTFEVDAMTGEVRFGDGVLGHVPPTGSVDDLRAALQSFAETEAAQ